MDIKPPHQEEFGSMARSAWEDKIPQKTLSVFRSENITLYEKRQGQKSTAIK